MSLLLFSNAFGGDEDTLKYIDLASIAVQRSMNDEQLNANAEISRYWGSQNIKSENHFVGTGFGVKFDESEVISHVLAKYSYMGLIGLEAGPIFWTNDYGGMVRIWAGLFAVGCHSSYSYTRIGRHAVDVGVFFALPIGGHRNSKYELFPSYL